MKANASILDRQPPRSLDAERAVLGGILLLPDVCDDVALLIRADDFYDVAHQKLFGHVLAMHESGQPIDSTLLVERLKAAGDLEFIGGVAFVAELIQAVPTAAHAAHYARVVREKSAKRRAIHAATELLSAAYDDSAESAEILAAHRSEIDSIESACSPPATITAEAACVAAVARAAALVEGRADPLSTGLASVDARIGGLFPNELTVLAARPRVGKTALAMQIIAELAIDRRRALVFSSEMAAPELMLRTLCSYGDVSGNSLRTGRATPRDLAAISAAAERLAGAALLIDDRPRPSMADIRHTARRANREAPLSLVAIDYLQRLAPADARRQRHEQVGQMATDAKTLARELCLPVVLLAQINREADKSADGRPTLAHLRESGAIEAEADQIWLLHRPELLRPDDSDARGLAELIVAKNRNGWTGRIDLRWDGPRTTFHEPVEAAPERDPRDLFGE